jgi:cytochrome b561
MNPSATSSAPAHYDALSRALHWIVAIIVTVAFVLGPGGFGRQMHQGLDPATRADIVWHESLGATVFVLTLLRLLWLAVRPAAPKFALARWMHLSAKAVQGLLWLLMLLLPITALLALASEDHPLTLLGGFRIDHMPWIMASSLAGFADWGEVHGMLGDAIMVLAGAHAVAAIYHYAVLKDGVLASMLPHLRRR